MRLAYVSLCGFRGFYEPIRIDIPSGFAIIVGPNGAGKSTVCDAVEFVLTGGIRASSEHKEKGESIRDYLWWRGAKPAPENYVEVGFMMPDGSAVTARRTPSGLSMVPSTTLEQLLLKGSPALENPIAQLCRTAILRDEEITRLSVDLRETDRFDFVTAALGAADFGLAEAHAKRAGDILKRQYEASQRQYELQRDRVAQLTARLSQLRVQAQRATEVSTAEETLRRFVPAASNAAELVAHGEREISNRRRRADDLKRVYARLSDIVERLTRIVTPEHEREVAEAKGRLTAAQDDARAATERAQQLADAVEKARAESPRYVSLAQLLEHGRRLGLQSGHCPLCGIDQSADHFEGHLKTVEASINKANSDLARLSRESANAANRVAELTNRVLQLRSEVERLQSIESATKDELAKVTKEASQLGVVLDGMSASSSVQLAKAIDDLQAGTIEAERALSVLSASQAAGQVVDLERELTAGREQLAVAEKNLSNVSRAQDHLREAGHAIKRVEGELVDEQLAALSPLLVELYERLRPHIDWRRVRYVLRGDVRRMLSLEVGAGLNPSFVFSSGQRRAAGLAFLLAIFLSRSWCNLRTLVLDDPVQHVDDYRALHLTEVLAAIRRTGTQIICTVEDQALAELLARRLRSDFADQGALIELAYEPGRGSRLGQRRALAPLTPRVLVPA
jgi:DNA repair exonuclease SbcCD ATPase subunit